MLMDGLPLGFRIEKSKSRKECVFRAQRFASSKNGGVPPSLAAGLCQIRHSLPLVGEQRCGSAVMLGYAVLRGGTHCARRTWW